MTAALSLAEVGMQAFQQNITLPHLQVLFSATKSPNVLNESDKEAAVPEFEQHQQRLQIGRIDAARSKGQNKRR